jgi:excisionase family DNA binding protein
MSNPLSAQQLAEVLAINVDTVRQMTRDGLLPHHRIGAGTIRYTLADVLAHTAVNQHPDDEAVDRFAAAMQAKMTAARLKGKDGWDDPERCSVSSLRGLLDESFTHCDYVDVGNYAMMLWARGQLK